MKKLFLLLTMACYASLRINAQVSPVLTERFQHILDSVCNKYHIKGTSAAILIPGTGVWQGVNGISYDGKPMQHDMLLGMGSNTKTHIAAVLLRMQEEKLISLDDTIGKWINGYPNISGAITIRQCLNHTSGIHDYMQNATINDSIFDHPEKVWPKAEILRLAMSPLFAPGKSWDYSNTNYIIAGMIIEQVLNKSVYAAIDDYLLVPHQLNNTVNFGSEGTREWAHPWSVSMTGTALTDMTTTPYLPTLFSLASSAGSLLTTATDNVWFWHKLYTRQLISEASWKEMTTMIKLSGGTDYGLGIFRYNRTINGRTAYSHGGTFFGYINENIVDTTSGTVISVMTNQDSINNSGLLALVIGALHKATLNLPVSGLSEAEQQIPLSVYPNPANAVVNVVCPDPAFKGQIYITSLQGQIVHAAYTTTAIQQINVNMLPNGMYLINLVSENGARFYQRLQVIHE